MRFLELLEKETNRIMGFIRRDFGIWRSYTTNFILGIFDLMFYVLFLFFLSENFLYLSGYSGAVGETYFAFLLTGAVLWPYASISLFQIANSIGSEQTWGTLEPLFATPVSLSSFAIGSILWNFLQTSITVIVIIFLGGYAFQVPFTTTAASIPLLLLVIVTTAVSLLAFGLMVGGLRLVLKTADPISLLFNWFNILVTGVYFPIEILPTWAQSISLAHPLTYALRAFRSILLEGARITDGVVQHNIVLTLAIGLTILPLGYLVFKYCFIKARKDASLRQY